MSYLIRSQIGLCFLVITASFFLTQPLLSNTDTYIKGFTYGGPGCPGRSVGYQFSSDRKVLTLLFDQLYVDKVPGTTSCTLSWKLRVPSGFQVTWHKVEHLGYVDIDRGQRAQLRARYKIPGFGRPITKLHSWRGPHSNDFFINHEGLSWTKTPCGGEVPMNLNERLILSGQSGYGFLGVDELNHRVKTVLRFNYTRC